MIETCDMKLNYAFIYKSFTFIVSHKISFNEDSDISFFDFVA